MFVHAQDAKLGLLVSRHTAEGTAREAIVEARRVVRAFDALECPATPKLHLLEVEEEAPLPSFAERTMLSEVVALSKSPRWVAVVVHTTKARLAMDIVLLVSPTKAGQRIQTFRSAQSALGWLLTKRPETHARCLSLLAELNDLSVSTRTTARDLNKERNAARAV